MPLNRFFYVKGGNIIPTSRVLSTYLALTISPEVHGHADHLVDGGVRSLVDQGGGQSGQRKESQAGLEAPVDGRACQSTQRPLPREEEETEEEVDDLEDR